MFKKSYDDLKLVTKAYYDLIKSQLPVNSVIEIEGVIEPVTVQHVNKDKIKVIDNKSRVFHVNAAKVVKLVNPV